MRHATLLLLATLFLLAAMSVAASQDDADQGAASDPGPAQQGPEVDLDLSWMLEEGPGGARISRLMPDTRTVVVPQPLFCPAGSRDSRCAEARRIVQSEPCTRPDDCRALQELQGMLGDPAIELLDGRTVPQRFGRAVTPPEADTQRDDEP